MNKLFIIILFLFGCDYRVGNRIKLINLGIRSNIETSLVFQYLDSAEEIKEKYGLPKKYQFLKDDSDIKYYSDQIKLVYFSETPQEVYKIELNGYTMLLDVFNSTIDSSWFLMKREKLNDADYDRIERRIDSFYRDIIRLAKKNEVDDTNIFSWNAAKPYHLHLMRPNEKIK
ncbi:MAG: hypothetical protein V4613_08845 [Bacteroidota bacterium]